MQASKSRLWDLFEQFGKVVNVHIVRAPHNGKPRGFGFVTFKEDAGAQKYADFSYIAVLGAVRGTLCMVAEACIAWMFAFVIIVII